MPLLAMPYSGGPLCVRGPTRVRALAVWQERTVTVALLMGNELSMHMGVVVLLSVVVCGGGRVVARWGGALVDCQETARLQGISGATAALTSTCQGRRRLWVGEVGRGGKCPPVLVNHQQSQPRPHLGQVHVDLARILEHLQSDEGARARSERTWRAAQPGAARGGARCGARQHARSATRTCSAAHQDCVVAWVCCVHEFVVGGRHLLAGGGA